LSKTELVVPLGKAIKVDVYAFSFGRKNPAYETVE